MIDSIYAELIFFQTISGRISKERIFRVVGVHELNAVQ